MNNWYKRMLDFSSECDSNDQLKEQLKVLNGVVDDYIQEMEKMKNLADDTDIDLLQIAETEDANIIKLQEHFNGLVINAKKINKNDSNLSNIVNIKILNSGNSITLTYSQVLDNLNILKRKLHELTKSLSKNNGGAKEGGCFIATSVYGSDQASQVIILSEFRDKILLNNSLGKRIVSLYYHFSPKLVTRLRNKPIMTKIIKSILDFFAKHLKERI